jgi:Mg/Co/Ni transporter MgtE
LAKPKEVKLTDLLEELKDIRRLLIVQLLRSEISPEVLAGILNYKNKRSLSNEFPVRKIREKATEED